MVSSSLIDTVRLLIKKNNPLMGTETCTFALRRQSHALLLLKK